MQIKRFSLILFTLFISTSAMAVSALAQDAGVTADDIGALKKGFERPVDIPYPDDNKYSDAKATLGKILYFDPRLSKSGTQSCSTCHNPSFGWEDGMALGTGNDHKKLGRASPTILNLAWDELYFWDGRADSLEAQALGPIESKGEMAMDLDTMMVMLNKVEEYKPLFTAAFPDEKGEVLTKENIAKAIATFERGVISAEAPFDKWVKGDESAVSEDAKRGFVLFNKKANCVACHSGWNFSDSSFHDIGLKTEDLGRGKLVANITPMQHAFKTVGLRNIDRRAPYMHDGVFTTLEAVVDHYNSGFTQRESLSDQIKPLNLTPEEKTDLVAFLHTLTSQDDSVSLPSLPR